MSIYKIKLTKAFLIDNYLQKQKSIEIIGIIIVKKLVR